MMMKLCGACAVLGLLVVPCLSARILFLHPLYSGSHEVQLRGLAEHLATARGHHITYVKFANTVDIPNNHPNISLITLSVDNRDGRHPYISRELQGRFDMPLDVLWEHGHLPHKIPPDAFSTVITEYCKLHSPVLKDSTYLKERSETIVRLIICHFLICPRKLTRGLPYAQDHAGRLQVCHRAGFRTMIALCDTLLGDSVLLTRLKRQNIRLAVIDLFTNECGLAFAYQLGIPVVGYWALPLNGGEADYAAGMALTSFSPISPSFMSGLTDDMNFYQRMKNALYKLLGTIVMRLQMFITNNLIQKHFPGTPHPTLLLSNLSGMLANVDHSLDYPRPLPPNVIPVGCMQCRPARRLPEIMELFVRGSGEAGVILFSLGATFDPSWVPKEILKRFLKTFSHLEQRVIVKYHGEIDMEVPGNVMIVSWLPQQDILGHPQTRVFFSHCGKQSVMEAVYHEVPIVAMPVFGDQIDVAGMLRAKGMGVVVDKQAPEEEIIHALNEVIYNYSYTKNVRKWRGVMLDQPQTARERAVWFLEHTIMEKRSFIVIGEAPESESEEEEVNIVTCMHLPLFQLFGISRSKFCLNSSLLRRAGRLPDAPRGTHTTNPQGIIVAGEAPESDEEREGERNMSLHKNLLEFVHLSVSGPVRDLNTANHQLLQSQVTLQEAATTLHTLHKSLTLLSSRLSDITSSAVNSNTSNAGDEKHLSCNNGEVESNCAVSANDTVLKLSSKSQKLPDKTHSSPLFTKCVVKMDYILVLFATRKFTINLQLGVILGITWKLIPAECGKMFVKRSSLQVHLATHTNNKPFICEVCGQGFSQKVSRDIHLVRHTGKYNYKCIKCDKSFPCRSKLNAHSYIHKTPQFACSVCCKKFVHRDTLRTHLLIHADKKLHQCSECHRGFTTKSNLRQHEQVTGISLSSWCFPVLDLVLSHNNLLFSCEQCGAKFRYQSSLTSHGRCHQVFNPLHQKEISKHTSTVMPIQERFLCPVCGKEFQRKHSLKTHEKCHRELSEGEVHLCHLCPNKYTQKSKLTQHLKTHLQEPQFCCEVCKKCFYRKDVYVKHMTTHSDQRPYCCAHCGKAFTFKSNLTAHLAMHPLPGQPIQMFRCLDCGREFRHKSSYTVHRKFHLGQFSHSCPTCGKQFTQKSRLASHIHCHSTDRPFVCPTCGRAYKEHKHRREHIKRAHPQEFSVESLLASITGDDTNVLGTEQQPLDGEHSLVTIPNQSACIQDHLVNHLLAFPSVDHQTILEQNEQSELVVPFSVVQDECSLLVLSPNVAMYPPVDLETTLQDIQPTQFSTSPGDALHCQGPLTILSVSGNKGKEN
uniref:C2H2-type domain-containing protein n=1 Tax=Timema shepardi TaxID=629360 RepID=A0A7R9ALN2_TIMSH|nr:unnamed protein product [Timema shepardi]